MTSPPRERIGTVLAGVTGGRFAARRTAATDDLRLEVKGVGPLRLPISRAQARALCEVARPARYGRGEKTLLDRRVRDTWEVPKSRVKVDKRRWNRTLLPALERLRQDLGLPEGVELKAELHSMLVYEKGQFFLPHQDSEKADEMVGTLVVTLPSSFKGGALVIEHRGEKVTYRGTRRRLALVAFYADCRHEVRPVTEGHRVTLTYNLMLDVPGAVGRRATAQGRSARPAAAPVIDAATLTAVEEKTVTELAGGLGEYFTTPRSPGPFARLRLHRRAAQGGATRTGSSGGAEGRHDDPPEPGPPDRLVYLLDHQYTERGLDWLRLKGDDVARAATLASAAERAGCEVVLALAEIHELWGCMEEGWDEPWYGRRRRWRHDDGWSDDDEWIDDDPTPDDPDRYELVELADDDIELVRWLDPSGEKAERIATRVDDDEICFATPTVELQPHAWEYTGYMGNWGNSMDRWYRRAAVVVWPRERAFVVRAEASPRWGLRTLRQRLRASAVDEAQELARSLLPFWEEAAARDERQGFFEQAFRVAARLGDPELAAGLLQPFQVEVLAPARSPALVALVQSYGEDWGRELLSEWSTRRGTRRHNGEEERLAWLTGLPELCETLCAIDEDRGGALAARLILKDRWRWLRGAIEALRGIRRPSVRDDALGRLDWPMLAFLEATAVAGAVETRREAVEFLRQPENEPLLGCLASMLQIADYMTPEEQADCGLDALRQHCIRRITERLAVPPRADDDWSLPAPRDCDCELCETLAGFLAAPDRRQLEWPINKQKRKHVHRQLDAHELPVRHQTRRSGRPFTLVLTKLPQLHERDAAERRGWQGELDGLEGRTGVSEG